MTETATVNLDKLRNIVQKFGSHAFTSQQVANDYHHGDAPSAGDAPLQFDALLHRHATLLGISAQPSTSGHSVQGTLWRAV